MLAMMQWIACVSLMAGLPKYERDKLPYRANWGSYKIVVEKMKSRNVEMQRLRIQDKAGKTLKEIQDYRIFHVEAVSLLGKGENELHIATFSGGAHCCAVDYIFTRSSGLKNLLIFDGRNDSIEQIKDLNGDGKKELIAKNDALAYSGDLSYAGSPHLPMILGWDGKRYVDQTRKFSKEAMKTAQAYQQSFLEALGLKGDNREFQLKGSTAGYYGTMWTLGKAKEAKEFLLARLDDKEQKWLLEYIASAEAALASSKLKIAVSQKRNFKDE